jgi:hypothetical protein
MHQTCIYAVEARSEFLVARHHRGCGAITPKKFS